MTRRWTGNMTGQRFCANTHDIVVHDLDNENNDCQIDEIITAGHDKPYDDLSAAHTDGYRNCDYCLD